jgi:hypothetical protein
MGLLGMGGALLTPRQLGGGIGPAMQAFSQQAMLAQEMKRRMASDAERSSLLRERTNMDREEFGFKRQQYETQQRDAQARQARIGEVRQRIATEKPELLPLFDMNPDAAMERLFPKAGEAFTLPPGARRYGPDNSVIAENPKEAAAPTPTEIEKLITARNLLPPGSPDRKVLDERIAALNYRQPPASMNVSYGAPFAGVDPATGLPMLYQPSNKGGPPQPTGLAPLPKPVEPPAEAERVAAGYAGRMMAAEQILGKVGPEGYPTLAREKIAELPLTGGALAPIARTKEQQLYRQAQEDWVRAKLRKESGAVIGEEEMAREIKTYFPQPNEGPELAAQKAQARQQAIAGMRGSAGKAPIPTAGAQPPQAFPMLPNASEHDGKIATDRQNGKRYKSVSGRWVEVK